MKYEKGDKVDIIIGAFKGLKGSIIEPFSKVDNVGYSVELYGGQIVFQYTTNLQLEEQIRPTNCMEERCLTHTCNGKCKEPTMLEELQNYLLVTPLEQVQKEWKEIQEKFPRPEPVIDDLYQRVLNNFSGLKLLIEDPELYEFYINVIKEFALEVREEYAELKVKEALRANGILTGEDAERFIDKMKNSVKVSQEERDRMKTSYDEIMAKSKGIR